MADLSHQFLGTVYQRASEGRAKEQEMYSLLKSIKWGASEATN